MRCPLQMSEQASMHQHGPRVTFVLHTQGEFLERSAFRFKISKLRRGQVPPLLQIGITLIQL